jgi:type II secretion system protein G
MRLKGFTLIELLIVMAILGILSVLGISNFMSSRIKAQDAARKSDLSSITKSLEAYSSDHNGYPLSDASGKIICKPTSNPNYCNWGEAFSDINGTIYFSKLPQNSGNSDYIYESDGSYFTIFTVLENTNDPNIDSTITKDCGTVKCNYKISSPNI